ncbi:SDR family NAD(P)-dependent oxidoreductase [Streptomyces mirabilis]|uniref:SDR family NAD(P)-dependent oxidoreductase n=1 Tax=Streptomyces mirabilis TaxID=68239 RepID=UPI003321D91A
MSTAHDTRTQTHDTPQGGSRKPLLGKVVVVTDAGRGFGRLLAGAFADASAQLVLTGRDAEALEGTATEVRARGNPVLAVLGDITDTARYRLGTPAASR